MGYDTIKKRKQWQEYAEQGDPYAQYELAQSYCCHPHEGKTNMAEAMYYWCMAARNGHAKSQTQVGKLYEGVDVKEGLNIKQDRALAMMWYELAKRRGNDEARTNFLRLKGEKDGKELIKKAKKLIETWKKQPCGTTSS